jgi:hypothetical protein
MVRHVMHSGSQKAIQPGSQAAGQAGRQAVKQPGDQAVRGSGSQESSQAIMHSDSQAVRQTGSHAATQHTGRQSCSEAAGQPGDSQEVKQSGRKEIGSGQSLLQSAQQSAPVRMVLLHNGGSCNACTLKRFVTFRCISKQTTLLNVAIT